MTIKVQFDIPEIELDVDWGDVETEASRVVRASMRRKGLPKGQNLNKINEAAQSGAMKEIGRQARRGGILKPK